MIFGEGPIIKNIAGDLNKLFLQGSRVGQPILNAEGSAVADQGTAALMAARDPVIQEITVGMSGEQSARYTVSGTPPLTLPNSLGKPLKAWSVEVSPYQEGTGDPAPDNVRPIYGTDNVTVWTSGKNLYSKEDSVYNVPVYAQDGTATAYADVAVWWMPVKPNTEYTVSCNPNEVTFYLRWINCDSNKGFINREGSAYANTNLPKTFTTPANCRWVQIAINQYPVGQIAQNDWEVMAVEGSTAADYEPYNGTSSVITLPSTVYTGTIGSEGGESRSDIITLDGTEAFSTTYWGNMFVIQLMGVAYNECLKCTIAKPIPTLSSRIGTCYIEYNAAQNTTRIGFGFTSDYATPADFSAMIAQLYAAGTPVQVEAKRVVSQTFPLTAPTIPTPTGTATTWATAEDGTVESMEVTYVGKA